jgi:GPH family glycoside/pentoside/hexuronide:cation symporter
MTDTLHPGRSPAALNPAAPVKAARTAAPAPEDRLPLSLKMSWGLGAFGAAVLMNSIGGLLLYYMTKVIGMPAWVAGVLLSAARLIDAFIDPVMGHLSDRTVSPQGRRRPFLFTGALLSTVAVLLVFNVPFRGGGLVVSVYVFTVLVFYGLAYSTFNVPFIAMPAEMTNGYHERSSIHGWRVIFSGIGIAVAGTGAGAVLSALSKGRSGGVQVNTAGDYRVLSLIFAVLILASMLMTWWGTRKAPATQRTETTSPWRAQLSSFLANKPFLVIIGVKCAQLIAVNASQAALFFMIVEVLKRQSWQVGLVGIPSIIVSIIVTPLLIQLSKRFGKRAAYMLSAVFTMTSYLSWLFATPGEPLGWLVVRGCILGVGFAGNVLFAMSMLTDAMELDSHRTGVRREGMYTALYSFVEKAAGALGPSMVGAALSMAGFSANAKINAANYGPVRHAALLGASYVPATFAFLSVIILVFYKLDQATLNQARLDSAAREG